MTIRELYNRLRESGLALYGAGESAQIARMIMEERWGIGSREVLMNFDDEADVEDTEIELVAREISQARPAQYIIGEAEFCGLRFVVREGVLIPRPESEELVQWIVSRGEVDDILDICSGSGALSVALSVAFPQSRVRGLELSKEALEIARENNARLTAERVLFTMCDALHEEWGVELNSVDVMVSNPPYIPQSEQATMRPNVTQYEPHIALFVPDDDPLLFYRKIAQQGLKILKSGGRLYYEIHEIFAHETIEMLERLGYCEVELRLDINDKPRMICATKR